MEEACVYPHDRSKRFLAAAIHKKILIYDIASTSSDPVCIPISCVLLSAQWLQLTSFDGHSNNVTSIAFNSEGKWLVSGSEDGTIRIWDLRRVDIYYCLCQ